MTNVKRLLLLWAHIRAYIFRYEFFCVGLFFICFLAIGCFSFRDYGVPYDEGTLSQLGMESYAYVFEGKPYPKDLPVLIVQDVVDPEGTFRVWLLGGLGIEVSVPGSWTSNIQTSIASFTASGARIPALSVFEQPASGIL
jgi:hypothetical protein